MYNKNGEDDSSNDAEVSGGKFGGYDGEDDVVCFWS